MVLKKKIKQELTLLILCIGIYLWENSIVKGIQF